MKQNKKNQSIIVAIALSLAVACSNSNFDGASTPKNPPSSSQQGDSPDDPSRLNKNGLLPGSDPKNPDFEGMIDTDGDGIPDSPGGTKDSKIADDSELGELLACLLKKANNYNFVLVFDNSGSQLKTDPAYVRRDASKQFIDKFNQLVARKPDTVVHVATVTFATTATEGYWNRLDGKSTAAVTAAIDAATTAPTGNTNYSPAFSKAAGLLGTLGAAATDPHAKNYVVFMTDGEPTDRGKYSVSAIESSIVKAYGSAIIAIAAGTSISPAGEQVVKELALPLSGDPVGKYYRAATPGDLKDAWNSLFRDLGSCK